MQTIEEDRSGQHPSVTDLLSCLTKSYYNYSSGKLEYTKQTKIFFLIGLGLEQALLSTRKEQAIGGQTDGIFWHVDSRDHGLVEMKSTRASVKKQAGGDFPESWILQTKSYCKVIGTLEVDVAIVYLIPADFRVYRISYSEEEIEDNWSWMLGRKEVWDRAVETGQAPASFMYNADYECKACQYLLLCNMRKELRT